MTSVADMHPDADDDLAAISPELVLVDPELARRLREREPAPAPVVVEAAASPLLRLVPPQEPIVEDAEPEPALEPVVVAVRTVFATDDLIVPRPAEVESPSEPERTNHPLAAIAARRQTVFTEPPQVDHLGTKVAAAAEPIAAADSAPVEAPVVGKPARRPRRWRRRVLSVVLAAFLATGITIGVLAAMGESPVSTTDVPGWPIADESASGEATRSLPLTEAPSTEAP